MGGSVLTDGFNHVALLTSDSSRLQEFYRDVFEAEIVDVALAEPGARLSFIKIGPDAEFNVFEIEGNTQAQRQTPTFERGRIDRLGLNAASLDAFEEIRRRLIERGAADEFVTDFGPVLSVFFRDPDGLEGEVCVRNPDAVAGLVNPPGTPAARYANG
jgi:catechol 2,3-dioxygenase-like lactoylglutathione lyase family enzyme